MDPLPSVHAKISRSNDLSNMNFTRKAVDGSFA
jgi:hypothetical protein